MKVCPFQLIIRSSEPPILDNTPQLLLVELLLEFNFLALEDLACVP